MTKGLVKQRSPVRSQSLSFPHGKLINMAEYRTLGNIVRTHRILRFIVDLLLVTDRRPQVPGIHAVRVGQRLRPGKCRHYAQPMRKVFVELDFQGIEGTVKRIMIRFQSLGDTDVRRTWSGTPSASCAGMGGFSKVGG